MALSHASIASSYLPSLPRIQPLLFLGLGKVGPGLGKFRIHLDDFVKTVDSSVISFDGFIVFALTVESFPLIVPGLGKFRI